MSMESETSPVRPAVIDLDPDEVIDESKRDAPPPQDKPPSADPSRSSGYAGSLVVAALVLGALGGGWVYRNTLSSYFPTDEMKALRERVERVGSAHEQVGARLQSLDRLTEQLKADVDAIEASEAGHQAAVDRIAGFDERLAKLETAQAELKALVAALQTQPPSAPAASNGTAALPPDLLPRLEALEKDVASLKTQEPGRADAAALTQALSDLKAKIEAGVPFADEEARIARMVPAAAGLDTLKAHASAGLPNAKGLAGELAALRPSLPVPQVPAPNSDPGWTDQLLNALSTVITIRKLDAANWQQVADKAIAFAEAGDLVQAVGTIDQVAETKPVALQQWRDRAAARMALEAALAGVSESVQRDLAARP